MYNVTILSLGNTTNSTGGEGHVAAGGKLSPFGDIGVGCGVNWENEVGYGGMTFFFFFSQKTCCDVIGKEKGKRRWGGEREREGEREANWLFFFFF